MTKKVIWVITQNEDFSLLVYGNLHTQYVKYNHELNNLYFCYKHAINPVD